MLNELRRNKGLYIGCVIILILTAVIAVMFINDGSGSEEVGVNNQQAVTESISEELQDSADLPQETAAADDGYYLVKETDGAVKVFWCVNGSETVYKDTSIAFPLLGTEDQQLLKEGVKLKSEEELDNFLENYDS